MMIDDERATRLELRAAEQERVIEELSGQIAEQWKLIDRLQARLEVLVERFLAMEERTVPAAEATKPPHY